jgi:hypothetical protein
MQLKEIHDYANTSLRKKLKIHIIENGTTKPISVKLIKSFRFQQIFENVINIAYYERKTFQKDTIKYLSTTAKLHGIFYEVANRLFILKSNLLLLYNKKDELGNGRTVDLSYYKFFTNEFKGLQELKDVLKSSTTEQVFNAIRLTETLVKVYDSKLDHITKFKLSHLLQILEYVKPQNVWFLQKMFKHELIDLFLLAFEQPEFMKQFFTLEEKLLNLFFGDIRVGLLRSLFRHSDYSDMKLAHYVFSLTTNQFNNLKQDISNGKIIGKAGQSKQNFEKLLDLAKDTKRLKWFNFLLNNQNEQSERNSDQLKTIHFNSVFKQRGEDLKEWREEIKVMLDNVVKLSEDEFITLKNTFNFNLTGQQKDIFHKLDDFKLISDIYDVKEKLISSFRDILNNENLDLIKGL